MRALLALLVLTACAPSDTLREQTNAMRYRVNTVAMAANDAGDQVKAYCAIGDRAVCARLITLHDGVRATIKAARTIVDAYEVGAATAPGEVSEAAQKHAQEALDRAEVIERELIDAVRAAREKIGG